MPDSLALWCADNGPDTVLGQSSTDAYVVGERKCVQDSKSGVHQILMHTLQTILHRCRKGGECAGSVTTNLCM